MRLLTDTARDSAEDIYFGQVVLIWGRWFVILAAAVLALWSSDSTGDLAVRSLLVVALMGVNFFLHGRTLMEKPANSQLLLLSGAIDLAIAGGMVAGWGTPGLESELYVLYYPLLFAFALVFVPRMTITYAIAALGSYLAVCLLADPGILGNTGDAKELVMRLITMGATAGLGTFYWRIQRARRTAQPAAVFPMAERIS
jgi:hypothetical protein